MDQIPNCSFCGEGNTTNACMTCVARFHLQCLNNNYRNGTDYNRLRCSNCREIFPRDIQESIINYGVPNIRGEGYIAGVCSGVILTLSIIAGGIAFLTCAALSKSENSSRCRNDDD